MKKELNKWPASALHLHGPWRTVHHQTFGMKSCMVLASIVLLSGCGFRLEGRSAEEPMRLEEFQVREEPIAWFGIGIQAKSNGFFGHPKGPFIVVYVAQHSPACRAGLQVLDEIISIDGDSRLSFEDIGRRLYRASTSEKIEMVVRRPLAKDPIVIRLNAAPRESMHKRTRELRETSPRAVFWDVFVAYAGKMEVERPKKLRMWKNVARSCSLSWASHRIVVAEVLGQGVMISVSAPTENHDHILQGELIPTGSTISLLESGGYEVDGPPQEAPQKASMVSDQNRPN